MKKRLVVLSAAALTIAAAVPALAFENEFHGMYRLRANMTNFQNAGIAPLLAPDSTRDTTVFEQRARIQYIAKASDDLKLVTHFEIDSSWGDTGANKAGGTRGTGAGVGGDTVNIETKSVYLDFNLPSTPVNMKVGLQPFTDAYKGVFLNDDMGGAVASAKFGAVTTTAAFLRLMDAGAYAGTGTTSPLGKQNVDVYALDAKFALDKDTTIGGSYYLVNNDETFSGQKTHSLGVNVTTKLGIVNLDSFLMYQTGDETYGTGRDLSAFAFMMAPKATFGNITVRFSNLYASGDDGKDTTKSDAFQSINGYVGQANNFYSSQMLLLMRNVYNMDSDNALVGSINNGNRGMWGKFLGADIKVNDKFNVSVNLGNASVAVRDQTGTAANPKNSTTSKDIGTEFNVNLNYMLYPNLTATVQGAVAMLGGYTKAGMGDVKDPYLTGLMMNYTF